jgi:PAS domain S-box-containing protein
MASGIRKFFVNRPFSQYMLIAFLILVMGVITGITYVDYLNEKANFERNSEILQVNTEENIIEALQLTDSALKLYDTTLNRQMREGFHIFMDEYNNSGMDPAGMDLEAVRQQLGENYDLYIINDSGVIEYSTYAPEIGLDFKKVPYFYEYLNKIRDSEGFFPDRVVRETAGKYLRKFAYMPTPDHRYILELGYTGEALTRERGSLPYNEIIHRIATHNPNLENIRIFNSKGSIIEGKQFLSPDPDTAIIISRVIQERKSIQQADPLNGKTIKYLFIDLKDPEYGSDTSLTAELTYNNLLIRDSLNKLLIFRILVALIAVIFCFCAVYLLSKYLARPIEDIVEDVDRIAKGDLDHKIRSTPGKEFERLEQSINTMISTLKDTITLQQKVSASLKESEERYKAISDLISDYAYSMSINAEGKFSPEWATGAFLQIFGYTMNEVLQKGGWGKFIHPLDFDVFSEHRKKILANAGHHSEFRIIHRNGQIKWISHMTQPVWDDKVGRVVRVYAAGQDITIRKQIEGQLRELNEELESRVVNRTVQLEAINRELESFSYMVSHDLRAPLRAIDGFSNILMAEYAEDLPDEAKRYLALVSENVAQMRKLIENLINFSHMNRKSLIIEKVYPADLVRESLNELRNERNIAEVEIVTGDLPPFSGDPAMMKLVFQNLISNALKFTRKRPHARIETGSFRKGQQVVYFVRDNGVGFDMHYRNKLFGVFQRLHPETEYEGTGLGLAIVQRIIHRHEGSIWAEGEVDKGATFYFTVGGGHSEESRL